MAVWAVLLYYAGFMSIFETLFYCLAPSVLMLSP